MSKKSFIDSVEVKSPCTENWDKMHGNDRVRFCSHCTKDVKNLSAVTRKEAMRIVRASNGGICIRYVRDTVTNRPLFADQLLQITRRAPGLAAGVMTASLSLSAMTYAQSESSTSMPAQAIVRTDEKKSSDAVNSNEKNKTAETSPSSKISGTIVDPNGAVIPNAKVTIFSVTASKTAMTTTDREGVFTFEKLAPGTYRVETESYGFMRSVVNEVIVTDAQETIADASLSIGLAVTVDVVLNVANEVTSLGGVMASVDYSSPLAKAVANEDIEQVRDLIIKGANVNGKDENYGKITPLFIAIENGNVEITRLLLDFGAKINARDGSKQTPLMRLDDDATPELVELLLAHDVKVNLTDKEGNTALVIVAGSVKPAVLSALIDAGADVNLGNNEGQTALMNAANRDMLESVRLLLQAGAEVNAKNADGETALDLASDEEIGNLLNSYGAVVKERTETKSLGDPK